MAAKMPLLETDEKKEVHKSGMRGMLSTHGDHMKVDAASYSETFTTGGNDGNDQQHVEKEEKSDPRLYFNPSNSLINVRDGASIGIAMSPAEEVREIYLKKMFIMPPKHEFYCPHCDVCIDKVFFCTTRERPVTGNPDTEPNSDIEGPVRCSACFSLLIQKGTQFLTGLVSPRVPESGPDHRSITMTDSSSPTVTPPIIVTEGSSKGWEILKSMVYGGLAELLASLSVVTSAASADATTLSIVALGIANLIGGLSVLGHNLKDLKASQPREEANGETIAQVDKYYELLGKRENFLLHGFVAILSFLIFGLVPPIVYGFSFRGSDDKDLKLAAVAGASLIGITLLGIAKAYIQRPNTYVTYIKTVSFYVTCGILASLLTYVAGALMKRLIEQLGWFQPASNLALSIPQMDTDKPAGWGSY
ncbi:membrane protein of ER body 2-like [Abrus precatorius]|uniref:Membrane protein of ER body 2-like n=1 Tax=Abrus precatorius TaxID=3816 RepID=A0A8B8K0D0_ABRPR|nr:membrane protein of ER body 2-like [Abrus precatorius]